MQLKSIKISFVPNSHCDKVFQVVARTHVRTHVHMHTRTHAHIHTHTHTHTHIYIYIYIYIHVYNMIPGQCLCLQTIRCVWYIHQSQKCLPLITEPESLGQCLMSTSRPPPTQQNHRWLQNMRFNVMSPDDQLVDPVT